MKVFGKIMKFLAALAAIAGAVYVAINYGDKIVAWIKEKFNLHCCCNCNCDCDCECDCNCDCECGCEEAAAEEIAEDTAQVAEEPAVQAEEADFEG